MTTAAAAIAPLDLRLHFDNIGNMAPNIPMHEGDRMKRFHVHLSVADLAASTRFYSGLFGMAPTVSKDDYAKWMLDWPLPRWAVAHPVPCRRVLAAEARKVMALRPQAETPTPAPS